MSTGVAVVLLFNPTMFPAIVSLPPAASTRIPVATFSTSMPRIVSLAPETCRPTPVLRSRAVPSIVRYPPVTVDASIDTLAAVSVGSGVAGASVGVAPVGRLNVMAPRPATSTASMAARSVHSGTEVELTTTVDPVSQTG